MFKSVSVSVNEQIISIIVLLWILIISITLIVVPDNRNESTFYQYGPNENLIVLGIKINTPLKY
jgi:hypothetical protein